MTSGSGPDGKAIGPDATRFQAKQCPPRQAPPGGTALQPGHTRHRTQAARIIPGQRLFSHIGR
jgi:hypothetical protein